MISELQDNAQKLYLDLNLQLKQLGMEELPSLDQWNDIDSCDSIYSIVETLAKQTSGNASKLSENIENQENLLAAKRVSQNNKVRRLNTLIDQKRQLLSELNAEASRIEFEQKEENRQFIIHMRPKEQRLERLKKRKSLLK